jgi:nitric oxide reductase NorQ protein
LSPVRGGIDLELAQQLVRLGQMTRALKGEGVDEGASTRLLIHAAQLIAEGMSPNSAGRAAIARALSDEPEVVAAVGDLVSAVFPAQ